MPKAAVVKVLLVSDRADEPDRVRAALGLPTGRFELDWTERLAGALERIVDVRYGCLLVDLRIPDEDVFEVVDTLRETAADSGIVVLTGERDHALGTQAIGRGADDYLLSGERSPRQLQRAIDCAVERARSRAKIRQLSARSAAVLHALDEGLVVLDRNARVLSANPAATRMLEAAESELVGTELSEPRWTAVHRDGTPFTDDERPSMKTLADGHAVSDVVAGITTSSGTSLWVELSTYPLSTSHDSVDGVVVSFRDIGARLVADDAARFQAALLSAVGQAVVVTDPQGRIVFWNPAAEAMHGWTAAEALGRHASSLLPGESRDQTRQMTEALRAGRVWTGDIVTVRRDGTQVPTLVTAAPVFDDRAELVAIIMLSTDISERKRAEETAQALSAIVTSSADAIFTKTLDGIVVSWNRGAEELYGFRGEDVVGQHVSLLDPDASHSELRSILATVAAGNTVRALETVRRRQDGTDVEVSLTVSPIFGEHHAVVAASVIGRDIGDRRNMERELTRQATHDSLTGLPNRTLLADRLAQAVAATTRRGGSLGLLFLDLDQFKAVNDAHGYAVGDELLVEVARRLRSAVGPTDTVARFGGDEFVVVGDYADSRSLEQVADNIATALEPPIDVQGQRLYASASIGIAATPPLDADGGTLLRNANAAMYDAKARGRARRCVFDPTLVRPWTERLVLSNELQEALTEDALEVHYQPMVELATGRLVGVEALVRWWHPLRKWVPPTLFVPLAEDRGLVSVLDTWVLDRACRDAAALRASGVLPLDARVSVNISAHNVGDNDLLERVEHSASAAGLPIDALELEVTETGLMTDAPRARQVLQSLRELGVGIALDDFGTGYSSLLHLRQLPVSTIKIDRGFVQHIIDRSDDLAIAASIIDLGRAVGLRTIAEGIETPEQLALLNRLGCTAGQGFLWSRALSRDDLAVVLSEHAGGFQAAAATDGSQQLGRRAGERVTNEHGLHRILRMHTDGASLATISAALNAAGYRTPADVRWHTTSVARAITDVAYTTGSRPRNS